MSWVLRHSEATQGERLVLLVLADHAGDDGCHSYPSVPTIAREARLSERQVQYALKNLKGRGEIEVERKGGGRMSTSYKVLMGGVQKLHPSSSNGVADCTPAVKPIAPKPSLEPPKEQVLAAAPRKRNEIWDALSEIFGEPSTRTAQTGRGKVCASLQAAGATPDEIFARAKRWALHFDHATLTDHALEKHWHTLPLKPRRIPR